MPRAKRSSAQKERIGAESAPAARGSRCALCSCCVRKVCAVRVLCARLVSVRLCAVCVRVTSVPLSCHLHLGPQATAACTYAPCLHSAHCARASAMAPLALGHWHSGVCHCLCVSGQTETVVCGAALKLKLPRCIVCLSEPEPEPALATASKA